MTLSRHYQQHQNTITTWFGIVYMDLMAKGKVLIIPKSIHLILFLCLRYGVTYIVTMLYVGHVKHVFA